MKVNSITSIKKKNNEGEEICLEAGTDFDGDGDIDSEDNNEYQQISFFNGVFEPFNDAPDGFSEELQETTWALGAEYRYLESFMLRAGYFNENPDKGARQFF